MRRSAQTSATYGRPRLRRIEPRGISRSCTLKQSDAENCLANRGECCLIIDGSARIWWNWQTRYFEVVVGQPVQVQVLLCAPFSLGSLGVSLWLISLALLLFL